MIVLLTAQTDASNQLVEFNVGAADFFVKPFSLKILMERLKALDRLKRTTTPAAQDSAL